MTVQQAAKQFGKQGGRARAASLTPARRTAIARKAARARWGKPRRNARRNAAA